MNGESDIARRDRLEAAISMIKAQLAALEQGAVITLAVGSGEVSIMLEENDMPPDVVSGIKTMLRNKITAMEQELSRDDQH